MKFLIPLILMVASSAAMANPFHVDPIKAKTTCSQLLAISETGDDVALLEAFQDPRNQALNELYKDFGQEEVGFMMAAQQNRPLAGDRFLKIVDMICSRNGDALMSDVIYNALVTEIKRYPL